MRYFMRLYISFTNKKSHWFQVSASKLLGDQSGNIKIPNEFFGKKPSKKALKQEKVNFTI